MKGKRSAPNAAFPSIPCIIPPCCFMSWRSYDALLPLLRLIKLPRCAFPFPVVGSGAAAHLALACALLDLRGKDVYLPQTIPQTAQRAPRGHQGASRPSVAPVAKLLASPRSGKML
jgi:hypothetical protein